MEKYRDYTAVDFLNDESFLTWLNNPTQKENDFWNGFLKEHPYKKAEIREATLVFNLFHSREEKLGLNETYEVWNRIQREAKVSKRTVLLKFIKYAAIFLLVFLSGGISYYFIQHTEKPIHFELAETTQTGSNEARIILSDGSEVSLEKQISEISYSRNGQQLIVNNDTINQHSGNQKEQINKVIIPYGKKSMIMLSDGTKVWLNAGSQLIYPSVFINKTRQVMLIGEAYFDVAKNPEKPFIVRASDIQIQVLGTRFDISAYPEDKMIQTVLEEGKVTLKYSGKGILDKEYSVDMVPNQKIEFNRSTGESKSQMVDVSKYISWKEGMLEFEKADLIRAIKQVERYYDVKIRLADPMIGLYKLSGKLDLKDEPEEVLNVIKLTVPIDWQKKSNGDFVIIGK
ncbi:MAG: FecR domain-containing protein [Prolixibacteraceae bacterium]|nr:FecR domain-containing protein [Prolixibacteraceae bacterium]